MGARPSFEQHQRDLRDAVRAMRRAGSVRIAAATLGLSRTTLRSRLEAAITAGLAESSLLERTVTSHNQWTRHDLIGSLRQANRLLGQENAELRARVQRLEHARKHPWKPARVHVRHGKEDIVRVAMPDSHGCYADPVAMAVFLADMKRLQPDEIIMLGDHVDCGGFMAQHHVIGYVAQLQGYSYEQDCAATNQHLDTLQTNCPNAALSYLEGNHEDRVERWCVQQALGNNQDADGLRRRNAPEFLLHLRERGVSYYRRSETYDELPIPGAIKRGKCIYVHDPGHSKPMDVLRRYGCSVVYGHVHRSETVISETVVSGDIGAWSPGCLARKQQFYNHSRPSGHTHGYSLELASRSGSFLRFNVPIIDGASRLDRLLNRRSA